MKDYKGALKQVFKNIGDRPATLNEIYSEFKKVGTEMPRTYKEAIRSILQHFSSDTPSWKGKEDLYERIGKFREVKWKLRDPTKLPEKHNEIYSERVSGDSGEDDEYPEGERVKREYAFFKRNPKLVKAAKDLYGLECMACYFVFGKKYGEHGKNYIECHHENPLSERPKEWRKVSTTSIKQVKVLCANCHRMVHLHRPALTFDKLKEMLKERKVRNETAEFECYGMKPWKVNAQRRRHRDFQRGPQK